MTKTSDLAVERLGHLLNRHLTIEEVFERSRRATEPLIAPKLAQDFAADEPHRSLRQIHRGLRDWLCKLWGVGHAQ
jgi:hypothetical protein